MTLVAMLLASHFMTGVEARAAGPVLGARFGLASVPEPTATPPRPARASAGRSLQQTVTWHASKISEITPAGLQAEYTNWKQYLRSCPDGSADVVQGGDQGVSEGAGYGLLLAVGMNDQPTFDALLKGVDQRANTHGLMAWAFTACGGPRDTTAAIDGDLDIAYALAQADARWGGYGPRAAAHIQRIVDHAATTCNTPRGPRSVLLPWDNASGCPQDQRPTVNPSYFSPAYAPAFQRLVPAQATLWEAIRRDAYPLLAEFQAASGGFMPEWGYVDGVPSGGFDYNACRVGWRVATDYAWTGNPAAKEILVKLDSAVDARGGLRNAAPQQNSCFLGGLALAATAVSREKAEARYREWTEIVGNAGAPTQMAPTDRAYYQGTLRVLFFMLAGGEFLPAAG